MSTGEDLKAQGMAQALEADAVAEWRELARESVEWLAAQGRPFTSDDLTALCGLPHPDAGSNRNNAVGAVFSGAARRGLIRRVGMRKAGRASSHARVLTVWEGVPDELGDVGQYGA